MGNDVQAEQDFLRAIELQRALALRFPTVAIHQLSLARSLAGRGFALREAGDVDGARAAFGEAVSTLQRYVASNPDDEGPKRMLESTSRQWRELSVTTEKSPSAT